MNSTDPEVVAAAREAYKFMMFCVSVAAAHNHDTHEGIQYL